MRQSQILSNHRIRFVLNAKNGFRKIRQTPTKSLLSTTEFLISQQKELGGIKNCIERKKLTKKIRNLSSCTIKT